MNSKIVPEPAKVKLWAEAVGAFPATQMAARIMTGDSLNERADERRRSDKELLHDQGELRTQPDDFNTAFIDSPYTLRANRAGQVSKSNQRKQMRSISLTRLQT